MLVSVSDETSDREVLESDRPVLLYYTAAWCTPCKLVSPAVEDASDAFDNRYKFVRADVDRNIRLMEHFPIDGIPSFLVIKDRKVIATHEGALQRDELFDLLDSWT